MSATPDCTYICPANIRYMARFTKEKQDELIEKARKLWCADIGSSAIASVLEVSASTVDKWARDNDFERSKRSQVIALSQIRNSILESYADLLEGRQPRITPEQASKYAAAFERFSQKHKVLTYMYEAFDMLTEQYTLNIQTAKTAKDREEKLIQLKILRTNMAVVNNKLNKQVLDNE